MLMNCLTNYTKMSVPIQLIIIYNIITIQAVVKVVPPCNETEIRLSMLMNSSFGPNELPSDLLLLAENFNKSNMTVQLQNCSYILTLKHYLYECATEPVKNNLPKVYYTALYAYVEIKYQIARHKSYTPTTNADIILLTNSFSSTSLNPVLERKLHLFFFYYGNWLKKLRERNFPFDNYENPRSLLLDMICELINDPLYRMYEREVIFFVILNNHTCSFIEYYYRRTKAIGNPSDPEYALNLSLSENIHSGNMVKSTNNNGKQIEKLNKSNAYNDIIMFQNVSITILNNKVLPEGSFLNIKNETNIFLNFSVMNSINLKRANMSSDLVTTLNEDQTPKSTTDVYFLSPLNITTESFKPNLSHITGIQTNTQDRQTIQIINLSLPIETKIFLDNTSTAIILQKELSTSTYLLDMLRQNHTNFSDTNSAPYPVNQNYQIEDQHMHNFTVWDIVEMDGPCKEGQQHVLKLNVQSLLTAIDEHVSSASLEFLRKLLKNVKSFPIEDYNARGELLRDLLPVIAKDQTDSAIKKSIEDILDHVILDGAGALPPKIKLECVDYPQENVKRTPRRTRRVFNIQFE